VDQEPGGTEVSEGILVLVGSGVVVKGSGVWVSGSVGRTVGEIYGGITVPSGVRVGTLGTHRSCPTRIVVERPRQFARWSCEVVIP
jgi:hypothetical protein